MGHLGGAATRNLNMSGILSKLKSPWVLLLGATLLAAGVAYAAYLYLTQREARMKEDMLRRAASQQGPKTSVAVPRIDAKTGMPVELNVFVAREIDSDLVYPDTVTVKDFPNVRGQKLARDVMKGRPLRLSDLQAPEVKDVSGILPAGTRAVTIEIDDINSISQTLRAGHRIDVFLVAKVEPTKGVEVPESARQQVSVFMQNLKVIAAGKEFQDIEAAQLQRTEKMVRPGEMRRQGEGFSTVTVLVTPKEAQRLLVGSKIGSYRVALRGKDDDATVSVAPLLAGDVMPGRNGRETGVEYIVGGGKGVGASALVPTLVPTALGAAPKAPAVTGAGAQQPARAVTKEEVLQTLKEATAAPRRVGSAADAVTP
jgi:pilus assembly protein CpaB